ncbi:MAG: gamma-butyrobetaine hydroxylase-like domain-containing protein [Candidatus Binataceae bacterium]
MHFRPSVFLQGFLAASSPTRRPLWLCAQARGHTKCYSRLSAKSASMPPNKSKTSIITSLNEVGRYAIGVRWADGHDSIYPLESLRRGCPCKACGGAIGGEIPPASQRLSQLSRLGEQGVFLGWIDGHETLYTTGQLRASCRCAHCVAEPEKPITGS